MDTVGEQLSDEECSRLGFKREELTRKRCIELEKFGLASILESCLSCIKNSKVAMNKVGHYLRITLSINKLIDLSILFITEI